VHIFLVKKKMHHQEDQKKSVNTVLI